MCDKKNVVKDEELKNVTGGNGTEEVTIVGGMSGGNFDPYSQQFTEPTTPAPTFESPVYT